MKTKKHAEDLVRNATTLAVYAALGGAFFLIVVQLQTVLGYSAIEAGARMLVSPHVCTEMIKVANRYQAVSICGAFTPSEMLGAIEAGGQLSRLGTRQGK